MTTRAEPGPRRRRLALALAAALALPVAAHLAIVQAVERYLHDGGLLLSERATSDVQAEYARRAQQQAATFGPPALETPVPFEELTPFDDDAHDWSNMFSQYAAGVLVFDANGDGRNDVYFCQDGRNWTRPTDARGVLADKPRAQHNGLYLNLGPDAQGRPTFRQVKHLVRPGDALAEQELLVEGYLFPRRAVSESEERPARQAAVAVAADFDADGRLDLLVGNTVPGMIFSDPKTQAILGYFAGAEGRAARYHHRPLTALGRALIVYEPRDSHADLQHSARGDEPVGSNSLYLNLGDQDGDGVPEWRDATRESGLGGFRNTTSLAVADVDRDGDLDVFVANAMDGDFFPAGAEGWAGAPNELFVSQLAQTGALRFVERGREAGVDDAYGPGFPMPNYYRLRRLPWLPLAYSFLFLADEPYQPAPLELHGQRAEPGEISWASVFQDVDHDGAPDLWVANDFGFLRLHKNRGDGTFERVPHAALALSGNWMALAPADFDGDGREDVFAGNLGGAVFTNASTGEDPYGLFSPSIQGATLSSMFLNGRHDTRHVILDGRDPRARLEVSVRHSALLPPDAALSRNFRGFRRDPGGRPFDPGGLDPLEFAWGATTADVQNDGFMDLFLHGTLNGRGGGVTAIAGTNPGRLLVGAPALDGRARLVDASVEHHVLNVLELHYERLAAQGYVWRRAPTKNWPKRDVVTSFDRSTWTTQGPRLQEGVSNSDLIQTAESGKGAIFADLDGDGFADLLLRNGGGYDSRSSRAANLSVRVGAHSAALPPHSPHYPVPTAYEPGLSRVFLNRYRAGRFLRVKLLDLRAGRFNRDAVGAELVVDRRLVRVRRAGDGSFVSNACVEPLFGLGATSARRLDVYWPDRERTHTQLELGGLADGTLFVTLDDAGVATRFEARGAGDRRAARTR